MGMSNTSKENCVKKSNIVSMLMVLLGTIICVGLILLFCEVAEKQGRKNALKAQYPENTTVDFLVLGDSIWDLERGETGIAALLEKELGNGAKIHNLAIKGSRAAKATCLESDESCTCLVCMVETLIEDEPGKDTASLKDMEYVILAYGLNDYFGAVRQKNLADGFDETTYAGAMCSSIKKMQSVNPELKFVIVSPTYCQGYSYGQVIHESTSHDYGAGTGYDYAMTAKEVAASFGAMFVDNYEGLGISIHNGSEYLVDATHLSEKGRRAYAENLADYITGYKDIRKK